MLLVVQLIEQYARTFICHLRTQKLYNDLYHDKFRRFRHAADTVRLTSPCFMSNSVLNDEVERYHEIVRHCNHDLGNHLVGSLDCKNNFVGFRGSCCYC